ncbi:hypothetical protein ACFO0S_10675 [Chryseomicrobium palamuruense]|uniref:DUF5673 domain-containing protein n=1 Tax=Chryseomicrobium palamuruense TaxID=682973 RepID=A0ABV8UX10_9BACL
MAKRRKHVNVEGILLSGGILLLIGSLFLPIPIILFAQDGLFYREDQLALIRHEEAFRGLAAAMAGLGVLSLLALIRWVWADKKRQPFQYSWLFVSLALLALPIILSSIFSYTSIEETGVTQHSFGKFQSESLSFDEMTQMTRHYEPNPLRITSITFTSETNEVTIPYDVQHGPTVRSIPRILELYPVEVIEDGLPE